MKFVSYYTSGVFFMSSEEVKDATYNSSEFESAARFTLGVSFVQDGYRNQSMSSSSVFI